MNRPRSWSIPLFVDGKRLPPGPDGAEAVRPCRAHKRTRIMPAGGGWVYRCCGQPAERAPVIPEPL